LSEEETNFLGGSVTLELQVANTTLLPLRFAMAKTILSVSVQLASDFHDALKVLFSSFCVHNFSLDLCLGVFSLVLDVVSGSLGLSLSSGFNGCLSDSDLLLFNHNYLSVFK